MARTSRGARTQQQRFPSLTDFYDADARRLDSREIDIGLWWRQDPGGPLHRAAWVEQTGELYLVQLGAPQDGGGAVEVLARTDSRDSLEDVLKGWQEQCGAPCSLGWLRRRAARLRDCMRAPQRSGAVARPLTHPL